MSDGITRVTVQIQYIAVWYRSIQMRYTNDDLWGKRGEESRERPPRTMYQGGNGQVPTTPYLKVRP